MIVLRPDQLQLKSGIYAGWARGDTNMLAVLPTGGGKSIVVSDIVNDQNMLGARQCVMAHRVELVSQLSMHVARRGISHRIVAPAAVVSQTVAEHRREFNGHSFINPTANCAVGGVDTLLSRMDLLKDWGAQIDNWTVDEAHHLLRSNKWGKVIELFPRARGLGVTATPSRGDGMGLGRHHDGVFDGMVVGPSMRELISIGALADYEIAIPESDYEIDDADLPPSSDFTTKKMREASQKSRIVGDVVKEYCKRAYGKRAICFTGDVETSGEIAQKFNDAGIPAASVSAKTPAELRAEYIRRFRNGQLWVLVNVDLFGEGFDVPAVEVVIMARPTASLAVYLQQFGRALRVLAGKAYGLVIDHVSNYKRHGLPDKPHYWTLDRREKRGKREKDPEEIELIRCAGCERPYERALPICPHCGTVPVVTPTERGLIEQIDGDLILLDRAKLEEMRKAIILDSPASVGSQAAWVTGNDFAGKGAANRQIEKIAAQQRLSDAIAQWAGVQRHKGRDDQQSYRRFFLTTGVDVLTALSGDRTRADFESLAVKVEGWLE